MAPSLAPPWASLYFTLPPLKILSPPLTAAACSCSRSHFSASVGIRLDHRLNQILNKDQMKMNVVWRKVSDYVRYDLKEIAFPSSLPDPPHIKKRRKLTWKENFLVLREASRLYAASWVRDIGPELRPNDYKTNEKSGDEFKGERGATKDEEPSTLEDLAVAARGGMETLRPALQRVYMTRASAYRDALKSFIGGYQEGIQEAIEKKEDSKLEKKEDDQIKST